MIVDGSANSGQLPSNRISTDFTVMVFNSDYSPGGPISGMSFACYELSPFASAADSVRKVRLHWQDKPISTDWYLALANFDTNRWDFYPATALDQIPQQPDVLHVDQLVQQAYVDDTNLRCLAAVLVGGKQGGRLLKLQVNNVDPVFITADIPDNADINNEVSFNASANDEDSQLITYVWDFGDGSQPETVTTNDVVHTYDQTGVFNVTMQLFDIEGGPPIPGTSEPITVSDPNNADPTVSLTANGFEAGDSGKRPLSVTFDAVANDSDGSIAKIEWDLDGDTVFELDSGLTAQQDIVYTNLSTFDVSVRVTDDLGGQAVDSVQISTEGGAWEQVSAVTNTGRAVGAPKMAVIGGRAAIVFQDMPSDFSDSDIAYVRATSDDGDSVWGAPVVVETDASSLFAPVLAEVNGKPAVLYQRPGMAVLQYEQAVDAVGSTWTGTPVDIVASNSFQFSLDIVNGFPAASYSVTMVFPDTELRYRRATDADGLLAWGTERVVDTDSAVNIGAASSLEMVNGQPAVSYGDSTNGHILYKRSLDPAGDAWGDVEIVCDAGGQTSAVSHLFMVGTNPAVALAKGGAKASFTRADSTSGDSWPATQPELDPDFVNSVVYGAGIYANLPCLAYQVFTDGEVRFLLARDSDGSAWNAPETVAFFSGGSNTEGTFIIVNGKPGIAWCENSDETIHFAVYK